MELPVEEAREPFLFGLVSLLHKAEQVLTVLPLNLFGEILSLKEVLVIKSYLEINRESSLNMLQGVPILGSALLLPVKLLLLSSELALNLIRSCLWF